MRDAGLSITYGVPPGMGPGEVTHLPVESGKHVAAGEPVVTVRTEVDYHTLRAERSGTVLVLVRVGEKVAPEAPLVILQADEDSHVASDETAFAARSPDSGADAGTEDAPDPEPIRRGPPPAWPMEIPQPGRQHTAVAEGTRGDAPGGAADSRRWRPRRASRRGGSRETTLRIAAAIALYLAGVIWLLPHESARLAEADDLRRVAVVAAAAFLGGLVWVVLARGGSAAAARSIGVIAVVWVAMAGLTAFSLLPTETAAHRAAVAEAAASNEPVTSVFGRQSSSGGEPTGGELVLDTRWLEIFRRAPNGASLASQASLHQKLRAAPISRPMLPEAHPWGSMTLPTNLPPKTRAERPPHVRATHKPAGADRMPAANIDQTVGEPATISADATVKDSAAEAEPAVLRPTAWPPDG